MIAANALLFIACWIFLIPSSGDYVFSQSEWPDGDPTPTFSSSIISTGNHNKTHAASSVAAPAGGIVAYWYAGSDEGARDVKIYRAEYREKWEAPSAVTTVEATADGLNRYIRKLGNPVGVVLPDGRQWLFYVSVSMGGWAGSSINLIESIDGGETWGEPRRLVTSPFFNLSTLVRNPPVEFADGSIGLPVYHEFIGKFGELLKINPDGRIVGLHRLSSGMTTLQPAMAATSESDAITLFRYAGEPPNNVVMTRTPDGGQTWTEPEKIDVPNPNGAISVIDLGDGQTLAALNASPMGRHDLSLVITGSDGQWHVIRAIEEANISPARHDIEFSYPALAIDEAGMFHLLYSWNHKHIKHVRFNRAWLSREALDVADPL